MAGRQRRKEREDQYESPAYRRIQKRLANNLRRLRKEKGWTQEQAAQHCDMSPRLLQMVEGGDVNATLTTIARLVQGFGVDIEELVAK